MTPQQIEAMKLALEALKWCHGGEPCGTAEAITTLEKALAQPEQEPVAWRTFDGEGGYDYRDYDMNENYRNEYIKRNGKKYATWVEPLYTTPPQRKPLTDEQIDRIWIPHAIIYTPDRQRHAFARAIEAAHDIKE